MNKPLFMFLLLLGIRTTATCLAQPLPDTLRFKIDELFKKWDKKNEPGCVAGVIKDGNLIYSKGFGLANIETATPNTPKSKYYLCSVSKQFAGYAISLLIGQGKIKETDDIRQYLSWVNFGKKITVLNLLNHTSGIRDDIGLAAITGLGIDGMLSNDFALALLKKQRSLNFSPGDKYEYSNANYVLLAEIVKQASGLPFREFVARNIFKPLGMNDSYFVDNPNELVGSRAQSYHKNEDRFENSLHNVYTMGDGGMFSTIEDMAKWVINFYQPTSGTAKDIERLATPGQLNNGKAINYAFGISVDTDRGQLRLAHNGGLAGYRTLVVVYPKLRLGFLVFGNGGDGEVFNRLDQMIDFFVQRPSPPARQQASLPVDSAKSLLANEGTSKQWEGNYMATNGYSMSFVVRDGRFWMTGNNLLVAESETIYHQLQRPAVKYTFSKNAQKGTIKLLLNSPALAEPMELEKLVATDLNEMQLKAYTGLYYSEELDCSFTITLEGKQLRIKNAQHEPVNVSLLSNDHVITAYDFLGHLLIKRDAKNKIVGFELNSGNTMHLAFTKIR